MSAERAEWLELRRRGIGGSDVAAIAGLHPYRSAWAVYWSKVGGVGDDEPDSEQTLWGRLLEDVIADEWSRRSGFSTVRAPIMRHPDHSWWLGSIDRLVRTPDGLDVLAVLEVKNPGPEAWRYTWLDGTIIPSYIDAQVQWYLGLTELHFAYLAVLVAGRRLEHFVVRRNDRVISSLAERAERFWHDHVLREVPPAVDGSDRTRDALDTLFIGRPAGSGAVLGPDDASLVAEYRAAHAAERTAADAKAQAGNRLIARLAELGADDGYLFGDDDTTGPAVTYRPVREVDWAALEAAHGPLDAYRRTVVDTKAAELGLGRKAVDEYRKPSERRRLHVRAG